LEDLVFLVSTGAATGAGATTASTFALVFLAGVLLSTWAAGAGTALEEVCFGIF
jgi:hypothetical protein